VLHRPLALASGLTVGDYALWNWSLAGNREILALISGLLLTPLAIAFVWLLVLSVMRLLAHTAQRPRSRQAAARRRTQPVGEPALGGESPWEDERAAASSSSKLAA